MLKPVIKTNLEYPLLSRGKVRDVYSFGEYLMIIATDRLSAFDVVFNEGIPQKGQVLNQLSLFWFEKTKHIIQNHIVEDAYPEGFLVDLRKRTTVGLKATPVKLECIVRGYLTGSGLKSYEKDGTVCGIKLPPGLKNGSKLPEPIFTPTTKAEKGHDENVTEEQAKKIVGEEVYNTIKSKSIELYKFAEQYVWRNGLVLADTKFEFGIYNRDVILIDEALTPDSSRYWLKDEYEKGNLVSLDKQYVRDYLESINWNKSPPPPKLPKNIIKKTTERYLQAYNMITGSVL